ncbi:MAG: hypothetical protein AAF985_27305, partial [Bacteroidota bacterium]
EKYSKEMNQYADNYLAEKKIEDQFYKVVSQMTRSFSPEPVILAIQRANHWKGTSVRYKVFLTTLHIYYGFNTGDYERIIKNGESAIEMLKDKKGVYNTQYHSFFKDVGVAQMATGQYIKAQKSLERSANYVSKKSYNSYLLQFYSAMNLLRAGCYQKAFNLYQQHKNCHYEKIRRQFAIIEAYLHFMVYTGRLKMNRPFRMRKFLNDTFNCRADKSGEGVTIIIAELLMYFAKDRGKFIDRVDTVKNYSYQHLRGPETQRAKWFIRILCTLPRANFHPIALTRLAKKQIENLKVTSNGVGQNFAIEIIPFGDLLDMIMVDL